MMVIVMGGVVSLFDGVLCMIEYYDFDLIIWGLFEVWKLNGGVV